MTGLLSYVHVKRKVHASNPTLVSTTPVVQEAALEEDGQALHGATSGCGEEERRGSPEQGRSADPCHDG